jgi:hypothetical protein
MRPLTVDLFVSLDGFASADAPAYFGYDGPALLDYRPRRKS